MTIALTATNNSGSDVETASRMKLTTDFLSLRFSLIVTKFDTTTPLDTPSRTSPITSSSGEGNIICTVFPKIDYDFQVNIPRIGDEMYLSLLETQEFEKLMISLEYIKQDGKWKVHGYYINSFKIADKNAMQWYEEALPYYGKGYLVPALFRLEICRRCLNPAPFLKYQKETEIMKLAEKVEEDFTLRYPLPMELVKINNSPLLYNIRAQFVQNDIVPVVWYITSYDLRDIDNLHVEADAMSPVIQEMFPGITEGTQYLVFKAFTELPSDSNKSYNSYGTVIEIK